MITGFDHIALAVNDLEATVASYRAVLGREPNWIGGDGGARHAWFQLPNMALDIITPHGEGAFGDTIRAHLAEHGEGIWAVAFAVEDAAAAQALIARRGCPVILVSTLAWHTRNLLADPRGSVMVAEIPPEGDALTGARVTVMGRFAKIEGDGVSRRYLARRLLRVRWRHWRGLPPFLQPDVFYSAL